MTDRDHQVFCAVLTGLLSNPNVYSAETNAMGGTHFRDHRVILDEAEKITAAWIERPTSA